MIQNFTLRHVVYCHDMRGIFIASKITVMKFHVISYKDPYQDAILSDRKTLPGFCTLTESPYQNCTLTEISYQNVVLSDKPLTRTVYSNREPVLGCCIV